MDFNQTLNRLTEDYELDPKKKMNPFRDSQENMDAALTSKGWRLAKKSDFSNNFALKGEEPFEKAQKIINIARDPEDTVEWIFSTYWYVNDDRPNEAFKTLPGTSQYSVWTHLKGKGPGKPGEGPLGGQFMGGTVGNSGKATELEDHLSKL